MVNFTELGVARTPKTSHGLLVMLIACATITSAVSISPSPVLEPNNTDADCARPLDMTAP